MTHPNTYTVPSSNHENHLKKFGFATAVSPVSAANYVKGAILEFSVTLT